MKKVYSLLVSIAIIFSLAVFTVEAATSDFDTCSTVCQNADVGVAVENAVYTVTGSVESPPSLTASGIQIDRKMHQGNYSEPATTSTAENPLSRYQSITLDVEMPPSNRGWPSQAI